MNDPEKAGTCPVKERDQITLMVSESIRGIASQRLMRGTDGKSMVLAMELLV